MKALLFVPCFFYSLLFFFLFTSNAFISVPEATGNSSNEIAYLAILPADCSARKLVIDVMKFK